MRQGAQSRSTVHLLLGLRLYEASRKGASFGHDRSTDPADALEYTGRSHREQTTIGSIHARNGYCTLEGCSFEKSLPQRACPAGSVCQRLSAGGRCFKGCKLENASDCRGHGADKHGGYECYAWYNLTVGGVLIANSPTCEPVGLCPCNLFSTSKLDCSSVCYPGNSTQMACRNRQTGAIQPPSQPGGYCLDTTASGP